MGSAGAQRARIQPRRAMPLTARNARLVLRIGTDSAQTRILIGMLADRHAVIRSCVANFVSCDQGCREAVRPQ